MQKLIIRLFSTLNIWVYRLSGGKLMGKFPGGAPVGLLTTRGRRSGRKRTVPILYLKDANTFALVASQGGAPTHPAWFFNLEALPEAELDIGSQRLNVRARRASAEEKAALWPRMVAIYPPYADYQRRTTRDIPVVLLTVV